MARQVIWAAVAWDDLEAIADYMPGTLLLLLHRLSAKEETQLAP